MKVADGSNFAVDIKLILKSNTKFALASFYLVR
jgi:hypothetical protein